MPIKHFDSNRVVFINLTEMDKYDGPEGNLSGGGSFVDENQYAYEMFNFRNVDGQYYGYTPPHGNLNIDRIPGSKDFDKHGKYIEDVLVVFTCYRAYIGRIICGFYLHSRVYEHPIFTTMPSRYFKIHGEDLYAEYNIICKAEDATLIDRDDRWKRLPIASRDGIGHGQSAHWYVDTPERQSLKNDLLDYIEQVIQQKS